MAAQHTLLVDPPATATPLVRDVKIAASLCIQLDLLRHCISAVCKHVHAETGPPSSAHAAAPGRQVPAPIKLTLKGFPRAAGAGATAPPQQHSGAADQPRPKKKRKKERDGVGDARSLGGGAPSRQHAPLPKLRLKSSSGGWDQQLAQVGAMYESLCLALIAHGQQYCHTWVGDTNYNLC